MWLLYIRPTQCEEMWCNSFRGWFQVQLYIILPHGVSQCICIISTSDRWNFIALTKKYNLHICWCLVWTNGRVVSYDYSVLPYRGYCVDIDDYFRRTWIIRCSMFTCWLAYKWFRFILCIFLFPRKAVRDETLAFCVVLCFSWRAFLGNWKISQNKTKPLASK